MKASLVITLTLVFSLSAVAQKQITISGNAFNPRVLGSVKKIVVEGPTQIAGLKVVRKRHELRRPTLVRHTELCGDLNGTLTPIVDDGLSYRVPNYITYEYAGKIFAYEVEYEFMDIDTGHEIGATTSAFYVDSRGDGTFVISCVKDFRLGSVPEWVRNLSR